VRLGVLLVAETPWPQLLGLARHAEATGWDSIWYSDHFMPPAGDLSAPIGEAWTTLAGLAAVVPRVRLGHLVGCNTYRHPSLVAKMAATLDRLSGGRFVLGLGAGWQENEHRAYGIPFYTTAERHHRLAEACQVIRSLLANPRTTFAGRYYQLQDAPLEPKPLQNPLPILIGAGGEKLGLRIAARYADLWNTGGLPDEIERKLAILDRHCAEVGRDPQAIQRTAFALIALKEEGSQAEADWYGSDMPEGRGALPVITGSAEHVREAMRRYRDLGIDELITADLTLGATPEEKQRTMDRLLAIAEEFRRDR